MSPFIVVRAIFIILMFDIIVADFFLGIHWVWYLVPTLSFIAFIVTGSAVMKYNIFLKSYTTPSANKIAITFDDGPATYTWQVLDVLRKYDVKASFFCIGKNMDVRPDVVTRLDQEGHLVANHSWSHSHWFSFFGKKRIIVEMEKTNELIKKLTGHENKFFRPPYGVTNPAIARAVMNTGMKVIGWNLRSFDTTGAKPEKVIKRVLSRLRPGSVLLLHDNLENTAEILEAILKYAKKKEYKCVRVDRIFKFDDNE
ncbi:MAG: polysaccharide deacetylase family protein [Fulvivirga sp.]